MFFSSRSAQLAAENTGRVKKTRLRHGGTPNVPKKLASSSGLKENTRARYYVVFPSFSRIRPTRTVDHRGRGGTKEESTPVRAIVLNRQALIVKRKKAARYFRFSSCFEFITSSNISHVGPCCVLGHFQLSFHGQAFDDAWSSRSASLNTSRRKKEENVLNNLYFSFDGTFSANKCVTRN